MSSIISKINITIENSLVLQKSSTFFRLDDVMKYDIPGTIEYILAVTGKDDLFYVGHSLGCAVLFGAINYDYTINNKVNSLRIF